MKKDKYPKCGTCDHWRKLSLYRVEGIEDWGECTREDMCDYLYVVHRYGWEFSDDFGCILHSSLGCKK